ncbi:LysR substrate-binding domain-containing protein [Ideonella sp. BN130291]|uniref:LysR substrate-binding domain-containing protein n=1 Tax=Ideonella sp. BN130291 TaxID=3112940 RepID=UPI002E26E720|nr:LysR substrate-binding domain-containing protein [Ideonella sp. BN130291]
MTDLVPRLPALPPLHALVAFEAMARLQSAQRAAQELGVTRSALSRAMTLLEHRLKVRLFTRHAGQVELTAAGRLYYSAVQQFARTVGDGLYGVSPDAQVQIRLSSSPALARLWLGPRLAGFRQQHPRIGLSLLVSESLADVPGEQADVALRYGGDTDTPGLHRVPLWREEIAVFAAPALARQARGLALADLVQRFALVEHPRMPWAGFLAAHGVAGDPPAPQVVCHDILLTLQSAAQGLGIVLLPVHILAPAVASGQIARAHPACIPGKLYQAVALNEVARRPAVGALLAWLQAQAPAV